jgi:hypothetical protein
MLSSAVLRRAIGDIFLFGLTAAAPDGRTSPSAPPSLTQRPRRKPHRTGSLPPAPRLPLLAS